MTTQESEHQLYAAFAALESASEAKNFLEDLCTPAEISAMADRWTVVGYIKAGKAYRSIYQETGVSATTVGRVARFISHGSGGYDTIYNRLKETMNHETNAAENSPAKKGPPE